MGLFGKKEPCPVCGSEVTGLFPSKISGGKALCRSCDERIAMPKELLKKADVEFVKAHLEYREQESKLCSTIIPTYQFKFGSSFHILADTEQKLIAIDLGEWHTCGNPVVLRYDQLVAYSLFRLNKKMDDDKTPGYTYSHTVTSAMGRMLGTHAGKNDFFDLKLKTTHPYWPEMNICLQALEHFQYTGFVDNMSSIGNFLKSVVRGEEFLPEGE